MLNRMIFTALLLLTLGGYGYLSLATVPQQMEHPHYVKISSGGESLKPWQGPWACVMDKNTHLLWEIKTDDETIHDADWTYSWFDGDVGEPDKGDCFYRNGRCDTQALITRTNHSKLCGVQNWRLPTLEELQSLIEHNDHPQQAQIATDFFPRIKNSDYWTQQGQQALTNPHFLHLKSGALSVNLFEGKTTPLPYRNAAFVVLVSDQNHGVHNSQMTLPSKILSSNQIIKD